MRTVSALTAAGATVKVLAAKLGTLKGQHGEVQIDHTLATTPSVAFDAVVIPGGASPAALAKTVDGTAFVRETHNHLKTIVAGKDAAPLLVAAGVKADSIGGFRFASSKAEWAAVIAAIAKLKHCERSEQAV
ncbi:DJ-1/PfpI family protein [Nevskia sp.]|uniref:DJ-1/PfpI family protein n=1 Tax=Nevskia sp. TaxID=1929292 RepID=UPI0025DB5A46|nr:DJ-1/PfpI family protein [Nevskia sp.]